MIIQLDSDNTYTYVVSDLVDEFYLAYQKHFKMTGGDPDMGELAKVAKRLSATYNRWIGHKMPNATEGQKNLFFFTIDKLTNYHERLKEWTSRQGNG